jgi:hypothetical protein
MDTTSLIEGLKVLTPLLTTIKSIIETLPKTSKNIKTIEALEKAERQLKLAEAEIMQGLGYELCRNHVPPVIMLSKDDQNWVCPDCNNTKYTGAEWSNWDGNLSN